MYRPLASTAAAVVLAATLVACGGSDGDGGGEWPAKPAGPSDTAEPGGLPGGQPGGEQTPEAAPSSSQPAVAKLGDTLTLHGKYGSGDVRADITLNRYEDHAESEGGAFEPPPGYRLVAVEFTMVSTGDSPYGDTGVQGSRVVDSEGNIYSGQIGSPTLGESLGLVINLPPGERKTGWVIFHVPEDAKITSVRYQMNSVQLDKEDNTGTWTLD